MRIYSNQEPMPAGLTGTQDNANQCVANCGTAGASAGPQTMNALGQMVPYGGSLASTSRQGGSNVGGQNRQPGGFPSQGSFLAAAALTSGFCPCINSWGGIPFSPPGSNMETMTACDLNVALCKPFFPPPNPRICKAPPPKPKPR